MDTIRVAERSQQALRYARREAQRLRASSLTPDHLLLGLLNDGAGVVGPGVVTEVLGKLGIEKASLQDALLQLPEGDLPGTESTTVPNSPAVGEVLQFATSEARALGHDYVGAEHLLLGVLQGRSRASTLLADAGLDVERAREEIRRILGDAA